jgi:hypothetical protein
MLDDGHRRRLDALLEVPDGARVSRLEQLRRPPTALTARALAAAVERIRDLRALDVGGVDLSGLPPARIAALARHAATARAGDLAQLAPERRAATLLAFAVVGETRATDDALEMFYELLRALTARVQRRGQAERLDTLASLDAVASALRDAVAVLLDPEVPDDQVRASVFRRVERESLAAAVADCERLTRPRDDHFEAELLSRYAMVRQFLPSLLATIELEGSPAGQPVLDAVAALRALEGRKKVSFDEVPVEVLSPAWRRLAGEPGGPLDRRAYTFAVLERLRSALRARDVFVPRSQRWSDPRAKLLAGAGWETARPRVCRTLGLSMEPANALPRLAAELEEAYRRTAGRLAVNTAVELDSGKVKLSALDRLDEPESLLSLRDRVGALLPPIDLPDLLAEVAAWTGFADEFSHVSEAAARVEDLALSVCAVLVAEAANVGLEPLARPDVGALTRGRLSWVAQNYLRAETLVRANARLVDYHASLPLAQAWGGGEVASADGLRFVVPVRTISAGPNPRYFGVGRGVTYFNYTSDQYSGFHAIVIPGTLRDSLYILDGLLEHETSLRPTEVMTDSASYSRSSGCSASSATSSAPASPTSATPASGASTAAPATAPWTRWPATASTPSSSPPTGTTCCASRAPCSRDRCGRRSCCGPSTAAGARALWDGRSPRSAASPRPSSCSPTSTTRPTDGASSPSSTGARPATPWPERSSTATAASCASLTGRDRRTSSAPSGWC